MVLSSSFPYECVAANDAFLQLTGYTHAKVEGATLQMLLAGARPDDEHRKGASVWKVAIDGAKRGGQHSEPVVLQTLCWLGVERRQLLRVQVSVMSLAAEDAHCPKLADSDAPSFLLLRVSPDISAVRTAVEARSDTSPGARVTISSRAPFPIESVSADWAHVFGMAEKAVAGRSLKVVHGPCTDPRTVSDMMSAVARGLECEATFVTYTIDGKRMLSRHVIAPLLSSDSDIEAFQVDVHSTEIVDIKDALKPQVGLVAVTTFDLTSDEGIIVAASAELCELLQRDPTSLVGQALSKVLGAANSETIASLMRKITQGRAVRPPLVSLYRANAGPVAARVAMLPVMDETVVFSHATLTFQTFDVTPVAAALQLMAQPGSTTAACIATAKSPYVIQQVSAAWCGLFGFTAEEVTGRSLQVVHGPNTDSKVLDKVVGDALAGAPSNGRISCYTRTGDHLALSIAAVPIMSEGGLVDHFRVIMDKVPSDAMQEESTEVALDLTNAATYRSSSTEPTEYPMTPEGHITYINGYTQLVLYPRADPTLEHCLVYLGHLREAKIVKSWVWEGDALHVDLDTQRVLENTQNSAWCRKWTADLRTWHAWWNRMLWVVSEQARLKGDATAAAYVTANARVHGNVKRKKSLEPLETHTLSSALSAVEARVAASMGDCSVCVVDCEGTLKHATEGFVRLSGYSLEHLLGKNLFGQCAQPGQSSIQVKKLQAMEGKARGVQAEQIELYQADGNTFLASLVGDVVSVSFVDKDTHNRVEMKCFCFSVEESSDLAQASDETSPSAFCDDGGSDPYTECLVQELLLAQSHTLAAWKTAIMAFSCESAVASAYEPIDNRSNRSESSERRKKTRTEGEELSEDSDRSDGTDFGFLTGETQDAMLEEVDGPSAAAAAAAVAACHAELQISAEKFNSLRSEVWRLEQLVVAEQTAFSRRNTSMRSSHHSIAMLERLQAGSSLRDFEDEQQDSLPAKMAVLEQEKAHLSQMLSRLRQLEVDKDNIATPSSEEESNAHFTSPVEPESHAEPCMVNQSQTDCLQPSPQKHLPVMSVEAVHNFRSHFEMEQVGTGFALCDDSGAILWCNQAFTEAVGYDEDQIRWCRWQSVLCGPETDEKEVTRVYSCVKHGTPLSTCLRLHREDQRVVWMQVRMEAAFLDPRARVLLLCLADVSSEIVLKSESDVHGGQGLGTCLQPMLAIQEETIIHALDCCELMAFGFPPANLLHPSLAGTVEGHCAQRHVRGDEYEEHHRTLEDARASLSRISLSDESSAQSAQFSADSEPSHEGSSSGGSSTGGNRSGASTERMHELWSPLRSTTDERAYCPKTKTRSVGNTTAREGMQRECDEPVSVICSGEAPYNVLEVPETSARAFFSLTGWRRHEVLGRSLNMFFSAADWPCLVTAMKRLSSASLLASSGAGRDVGKDETETDTFEARGMRKDGKVFECTVTLHPVAQTPPTTNVVFGCVVNAVFLKLSTPIV